MKVRNFYKNGKEIKDLSKVVLPKDKQMQLIRILYNSKRKAPSAKDAKTKHTRRVYHETKIK